MPRPRGEATRAGRALKTPAKRTVAPLTPDYVPSVCMCGRVIVKKTRAEERLIRAALRVAASGDFTSIRALDRAALPVARERQRGKERSK